MTYGPDVDWWGDDEDDRLDYDDYDSMDPYNQLVYDDQYDPDHEEDYDDY